MMDRALKERIIGAIVIVLFVVLVVPVFLDGPTNSGEMISEQVPLPGQSGDENSTIILERDRTEPVPVATNNSQPATKVAQPDPTPPTSTPTQAAQRDPEPQVAQEEAQTPPVDRPAAEPAVSSTTGMWAVQLGSFGNRENAEKLAADLRKRGFLPFLSKLSTSSGELHRVRIGPQKDRASAEAVAAELQKAGRKGQVVPHP